MLAIPRQLWLKLSSWLAIGASAATVFAAQAPAPRIQSAINSSEVVQLKGSMRPFALPQYDAGRVPADTNLVGMTLRFERTAAQEADLQQLLAAQQNPASPLFHKWLTPEQFGARFGMAQADIDQVTQWLEQQGFKVDYVGRSRNMIRFSGTAGQVELAFQTQLHYYKVSGEAQMASSTPLSVPAAIAPTIEAIQGVSPVRPRAAHILPSKSARPQYTFWGNTQQYVLFAPGDLDVAYDVKPLLQGGFNGAGQTIAVMGESEIHVSDVENFQQAAGLNVKDPQLVYVPSSGTPAYSSGDEGESDLDVEWAGAMASGANIVLVYTGSTDPNGVFDSLAYAIDADIGNIVTISYGSCEAELNGYSLDSAFEQASTQGQTIIASSGDYGSTSCYGYNNLSQTQWQTLGVNYPASSEYVTGIGGTEITSANDVVGTYWASDGSTANGNIVLTSALSYIPEVAWNDDTLSGTASPANGGGLSATGGGVSTLYSSKPSWQTGVPGIPNDHARDVPDVSLYSSPNYPGYLYCTSDQTDWGSGQQGSCGDNQFYDPSSLYFTVAGGTSFAAPIFAGMVAILNQKAGYTHGQGQINPALYSLAANATTYATAFHDVTTGNNYCTAGTTYGYCSASGATEGYAAGVGYDLVTGLGSVDLNALATAWTPNTSTLIGTLTTLSAVTASPTANQADNVTITVASATGNTVPSGSISVSVNGGTATNYTLTSNGTYVLPETFTSAGTYTIVAQYLGDSTHDVSSGSISLTVGGTSSGTGTFSLAATNLSVASGSTGNSTVTITPSNGYTGTINFQLQTSSSALQTYGCYNAPNAIVSGAAPVTTSITLITAQSACPGMIAKRQARRFAAAPPLAAVHPAPAMHRALPIGVTALAGLLLLGFRRRSKWIATLGCLVLLGLASLAIGCGGGSSGGGGGGGSTGNNVPAGTYPITLVGADSNTSTITAQASFTLTVTQ